ncbi:hypothetical protein TNCT_365931 [Trichonephila clavata]|uniref:Peptidase aspartic putative domain-containing protein n=1 Tax=Trichonephila clavata TaxID=2740835 RepID=A0A8X6JBE4_TRICU|nr:hypothetical protein TNCT_365931 [Trichonephila clavata]
MSKEILVVLNHKRGSIKAQLTRIKDFINNPVEKDKIKLVSKMDTLKSLRIKLSDIRNEYYEVVANDSDLEPLELEILDLEDVIAKICRVALCKSSRNCHKCSKRHNSLLCGNFERKFDSQRSQISETLPTLEPKSTTTLNVNSECFKPKQTIPYVESFENEGEEFVGHAKDHSTVMLSTAIVYCQNNRGELFLLRTLLDCGSQSILISQDAVLALGLQGERANTFICDINGTSQMIKKKVSAVVSNKN